ncbi:uncharacterized protein LOC133182556 [Saccostrea echinata]|uniref:uncharacterized protein LOC133182556 n=1 Tax=Saccostrea echinata TaxID=191078 RepID=UPI002A81F8E7|nr:uncharacterized protein LOC133182556 [Saccostrea echinata]
MNSVEDSRYNIPVLGLGTPYFYLIHCLTLICTICSITSVLAILVISFRSKTARTFFKSWSKCERFAVYLAFCDGFLSLGQFMDHFQMAIAKDHVHPIELCEFYGFVTFLFCAAQMFLVSLIAINAFALMKFSKNIFLGKYDWKLYLLMFGIPLFECLGATFTDEIGPMGAMCGVAGNISFLFFSTIPVLIVMTLNTALYTLTWYKIRMETNRINSTIGNTNPDSKATQAAKTMSLFVFAFLIQWWAVAIYGTWKIAVDDVPVEIFIIAMMFANTGGVLNGFVYLYMYKSKKLFKLDLSEKNSNMDNNSDSEDFENLSFSDDGEEPLLSSDVKEALNSSIPKDMVSNRQPSGLPKAT